MWRAAGQLGIDPDAAASADLGGLAEIGPQVVFGHPLIRSVAYHAMPRRQRRRIHQALAAAGDGEEPDRVAWHLGMAAAGPDEAVAARLEQAAGQARDRGGYTATVTFLSRAAELSAEEGQRGPRLLAASEAALGSRRDPGSLHNPSRQLTIAPNRPPWRGHLDRPEMAPSSKSRHEETGSPQASIACT